LITVRVMREQIETARADEAERALTRYTVAIFEVMQRYQNVGPPRTGERPEDAKLRFRLFDEASDDATIRAAMVDSVFGRDRPMIAAFLNHSRMSALDQSYGRDHTRHTNMVLPLYIALTEGIEKRKALLREGVRVSTLYTLSTIDEAECQRAYVEGRTPQF
jgi:hypothetical protein